METTRRISIECIFSKLVKDKNGRGKRIKERNEGKMIKNRRHKAEINPRYTKPLKKNMSL